jgi:NADPH:quinone reductase-like Zn-dependent oxidoreductase
MPPVLHAPPGQDLQALAALPYSFVTMWLAVHGAGVTRENATGKKVLVHGAAGGLGTLALQMLSGWGAHVTAIAKPPAIEACRLPGASAADAMMPNLMIACRKRTKYLATAVPSDKADNHYQDDCVNDVAAQNKGMHYQGRPGQTASGKRRQSEPAKR